MDTIDADLQASDYSFKIPRCRIKPIKKKKDNNLEKKTTLNEKKNIENKKKIQMIKVNLII